MITIFRVLGIYLGLIQADTGDLCVACQYDLAPRGGAFCKGCDNAYEELLKGVSCDPWNKCSCELDCAYNHSCHPVHSEPTVLKCKLCGERAELEDGPCEFTYAEHSW